MKATARKRRKRLEVIFRQVVHEWDPYGLLAMGCPEDEFNSEILSVVRQADRVKSPLDGAHVLSRIFTSAFDPQRFTPGECREPGERLYNGLDDAKLIENQGSG